MPDVSFFDLIKDTKKNESFDKIEPISSKKKYSPKFYTINEHQLKNQLNHIQSPKDTNIHSKSILFYAKLGVSHAQIKKWYKKIKNLPPSIDLHGYTLNEYPLVLEAFIKQHKKIIHIIHGKGSQAQPPKIKAHLNTYLREHAKIIGFCSCSAQFGGTGALLVWLKTSRFLHK